MNALAQIATETVQAMPVNAEPKRRIAETSDDYPTVVRIGERCRVIACPLELQWIVQVSDGFRRGERRWTGRSYCRTKAGLIGCVYDHAGPHVDGRVAAILDRLPAWIGGRP